MVAMLEMSMLVAAQVKLILDTDMGGGDCQDCDDVGTVCMLNALADNGEVELLAIVLDTMPDASAAVISVLQHYYQRDDVPIGAYKGGHNFNVREYAQLLASHWPSPIKHVSQLPSGVEVYRRVLAAQPDGSVVISSVGMFENLAALLRSGPDEHSPLSGPSLLSRKVRLLAVMGGRYPWGSECNFCASPSTKFVVSHLPNDLRVVFSGQEVGLEIHHGAALTYCSSKENPCRQAYISYLGGPGRNRFSWDPITTLYAVRGAAVPGIEECTDCNGRNQIHIHNECENEWVKDKASLQTYLKLRWNQKAEFKAAGAMIDELLCQPRNRSMPLHPPPPPPQSTPPMPPWLPSGWLPSKYTTSSLSPRSPPSPLLPQPKLPSPTPPSKTEVGPLTQAERPSPPHKQPQPVIHAAAALWSSQQQNVEVAPLPAASPLTPPHPPAPTPQPYVLPAKQRIPSPDSPPIAEVSSSKLSTVYYQRASHSKVHLPSTATPLDPAVRDMPGWLVFLIVFSTVLVAAMHMTRRRAADRESRLQTSFSDHEDLNSTLPMSPSTVVGLEVTQTSVDGEGVVRGPSSVGLGMLAEGRRGRDARWSVLPPVEKVLAQDSIP